MNAIGKGFSALAGLGGMAMGGDAPAIQDGQTPWNMQQLQTMDIDYRNRLQDWTDKKFRVDASNNDLLNREIDQDISAQNARDLENLRTDNDMMLAEQKANYALQQLQAKSQQEQRKEMESLGIDPSDPKAYEKYLQLQRQAFNTDQGYIKARTNWNNRVGSGTSNSRYSGGQQKYDNQTLIKGRNAMMEQLKAEKAEALKNADPLDRDAIIKQYDGMIEDARKYKPGVNPLIDDEMMKMGIQVDEGPGLAGNNADKAPDNQRVVQFDQNRGFTNIPKNEDPAIKTRLTKGFQKAFEGTIDENDLDQMIKDLIEAGEAENEEEAYFFIEKYIEENQNNQ